MGMGGSLGSAVTSAIAQTNAQSNAQNSTTGANYTPAQRNPIYVPQQYQPFQTQMVKGQEQLTNNQSGLQAAMAQIMQQYNRPMMKEPVQQGLSAYTSPALNYKPDMSGITANLKRVAPSVVEQQRLQSIEDARIAAEQKAIRDEEERQRNLYSSYSYDPGAGS
jgi:hypothetical protein